MKKRIKWVLNFGAGYKNCIKSSVKSGLRETSLDFVQLVLNCRPMETKKATKMFEALMSPERLGIFKLLVKHAPEGLVAGELSRRTGIPKSNLSFHLAAIVSSGLVSMQREGRNTRYRASISLMLEVIAYLTAECCSGSPDYCRQCRTDPTTEASMNILFLCTGNSCRSIIAEALFRAMAPAGVRVQSAGSKPAGYAHPRALAALAEAGICTQGLESKSWDNLPQKPTVVITLCAGAAGEACPVYFGNVVRSHWGMPDPAGVQGDEAAIGAAFAETLAVLRRRITALVRQLEADPAMDTKTLQDILDGIAVQ